MSSEIDKKLDEACAPVYLYNNKKIEETVKRNLSLIDSDDLENVHMRILKVLGIETEKSSRYFSFAKFKALHANTILAQLPSEFEFGEITEVDLL